MTSQKHYLLKIYYYNMINYINTKSNFQKMQIDTYKTLVIGGSENPERYSNKAIKLLLSKGVPVVAIGNKIGEVEGVKLEKEWMSYSDIHTITLYINSTIQKEYYEYILSLKPKRIIFNPGTENPELFELARTQGIEVENACTLVLLNLGQYAK